MVVVTPSPRPAVIRLACSTASVLSKPLRMAFALIADAGFSGVEVMVTKDPATQDPRAMRDLADEHGLRIDAIHAPFLLITRKVWGTDPIGKIYRAIELASEADTPIVVVHPPYRWQVEYRRWLEDRLPGLEHATGVRVAVENMFPLRVRGRRLGAFHANQSLEELETFPDVVFDTSHAAVAGLDLLETLPRLSGRLAHVHLSNNAGKGWDSHLPVDEGVLALDGFLRALSEDGYSGAVSLELDLRRCLSDDGLLRDALIRNRRFCEERLGTVA